MKGGKIVKIGWQNPKDHKVGFGFRVRISIGGGYVDIYAHLDPKTVTVTVGSIIGTGDYLGNYFTNSPNSSDSGPHVHFQRDDPKGNAVTFDFSDSGFPVKNGRMTSGFSLARNHPTLGIIRPHEGYDFVDP